MNQILPQVWFYATSLIKGKVSVHDIATGRTMDVAMPPTPAVTCLQLDTDNNIWVGYRGGSVRVYSEATRRPICSILRCCNADITYGPLSTASQQCQHQNDQMLRPQCTAHMKRCIRYPLIMVQHHNIGPLITT